MKLIKAFIHHVRAASVVEALADAGFRNLTLQDVRGMLKPITENERDFTADSGGSVISEVRLSLVVEDPEVEAATSIIRTVARVGPNISGYVYVSAVEQMFVIGGDSLAGTKSSAPATTMAKEPMKGRCGLPSR